MLQPRFPLVSNGLRYCFKTLEDYDIIKQYLNCWINYSNVLEWTIVVCHELLLSWSITQMPKPHNRPGSQVRCEDAQDMPEPRPFTEKKCWWFFSISHPFTSSYRWLNPVHMRTWLLLSKSEIPWAVANHALQPWTLLWTLQDWDESLCALCQTVRGRSKGQVYHSSPSLQLDSLHLDCPETLSRHQGSLSSALQPAAQGAEQSLECAVHVDVDKQRWERPGRVHPEHGCRYHGPKTENIVYNWGVAHTYRI